MPRQADCSTRLCLLKVGQMGGSVGVPTHDRVCVEGECQKKRGGGKIDGGRDVVGEWWKRCGQLGGYLQ